MHDSASFEIKALLTLALLKSGTSAKDIQTAVSIASAARLMAAQEYAELARSEESRLDSKVTNIRGEPISRKPELNMGGVHSEIKALLSLLLLQHGASQKEILTTLRLATAAAAQMAEEDEDEAEQMVEEEVPQQPERRNPTAKQTLRNEQLAPAAAKVMRAA
jgi:hypothetical protein